MGSNNQSPSKDPGLREGSEKGSTPALDRQINFHPLTFAISLSLALIAGVQIGRFSGGFSANVYDVSGVTPGSQQPGEKADAGQAGAGDSLVSVGKNLYSNCVPCHQASGLGLPGQFPPLAGSDWVTGSDTRLVAVLLKGLQGPVVVNGAGFNGAMPAWEKSMSPKKIAAVASYVRNTWGNKAGEISEARVVEIAKQIAGQTAPWTQDEILKLPEAVGGASSESVSVSAPQPKETQQVPVSSSQPSGASAADPSHVKGSDGKVGQDVYNAVCVACHQPSGGGLPPVFPPLSQSEFVGGAKDRLIAIVLKGVSGPLVVNGLTYSNAMPAQEMMLSDERIAAVLTYVRSSFGNNFDSVSPSDVEAVRAKYLDRKLPWSEGDLKAWR